MVAPYPPTNLHQEAGNPRLRRAIAQHIQAAPGQRISFATYMDWVLYHPSEGYYVTNRAHIGAEGDFVTSPHLAADFGELLAEQFADMWQRLGCPVPFTLVEMGAGQGLIIQDVLRYLHRHHFECFEALEYIVVEKSPAMVAAQQRQFANLTRTWQRLSWRTWDEISPHSVVGCFFSNELVDAFPVHRVVVDQGRLREIYVTTYPLHQQASIADFQPVDESALDRPEGEPEAAALPQFIEVVDELSTPRLQEYFQQAGIDLTAAPYPSGYQTEVNLAALDWMQIVGDRLQRGYVLTIDYGYPAQRYYSPSRAAGTLQCYYQHAYHSDPYRLVGHQDLTAHVDFTALERQGERCGLQSLGLTQQGLFLMALGLGDRLAALSQPAPEQPLSASDLIRRREALHALINPMGLGNFSVLLQAKGLAAAEVKQPLLGLQIPPMPTLG
ncbi:MAG: class I SAM-dependent methyltransferase [Synechococcales bacterium]|nr:class I SAM-dependent methyltransferase [Synechococcales bacterium]